MNIQQFLLENNIDKTTLDKHELTVGLLESIYLDYIDSQKHLENTAKSLVDSLHKESSIHSIRYRIKNPKHLLLKIIRKCASQNKKITFNNYKDEITDLIGIRLIHLFKEDWATIHSFINNTWQLKKTPLAYYRNGDNDEYINTFKKYGCDTKPHPNGYRSVHYLVKTMPVANVCCAEIQVRTIFEEAWSEIDHTVRYPNHAHNLAMNHFLVIFNRLAGSADEMGSYVRYLQKEFNIAEERKKIAREIQLKTFENLKLKLKDTNIPEKELDAMINSFENLLGVKGKEVDFKEIEAKVIQLLNPMSLMNPSQQLKRIK